MGLSLAHVAVTAKDMDETMRFYEQAIGLSKAFELADPETGAPWIVYMKVAENQFVELFYGGEDAPSASGNPAGFSHLCFAVDDIQFAANKISAAGYEITSGPSQGSDGNWQCWTVDPNGVRVELMRISEDSLQAKSV